MYNDITQLRLHNDPDTFYAMYDVVQQIYGRAEGHPNAKDKNEKSVEEWEYFHKNYGPNGIVAKPWEWSRAFPSVRGATPHNIYTERYVKYT